MEYSSHHNMEANSFNIHGLRYFASGSELQMVLLATKHTVPSLIKDIYKFMGQKLMA